VGTPPTNLGMQQPGAGAGHALGWILASRASTRQVCGFRLAELLGDGGDPCESPNDFTTSWTASHVGITPGGTDPKGGTTADLLTADAVNGPHTIALTASRTFTAGQTYTVGFFHKQNTVGVPALGVQVVLGSGTISAFPVVGTADVVSVSAPVGNVDIVSAESFELTNGWAVLALTFHMSTTDTGSVKLAFNGSFAGANTGHYAWGVFTYGGDLGTEGFENAWQSTAYLLGLTIGTNALRAIWVDGTVNPSNFDGFEGGWGNTPFLVALGGAPATFNTTVDLFEGFEREWLSNESYLLVISSGTNALWNEGGTPSADETFEASAGWDATYQTTIGSGVAATFDGLTALGHDNFEQAVPDVVVSADPIAHTFTALAHGLANGTSLFVLNDGGFPPAGLIKTVNYYVVNTTTNTFQLSLTVGGSAVAFTDAGTGQTSVRGDPSLYWNGPDINPTI
jgi:hypothetical protein